MNTKSTIFIILIILIFNTSCNQDDESKALIPTKGLILDLPFNGSANDNSGNDNHGVVYGGVSLTSNRHNEPNSCYDFNGIDGFIEINPVNDVSQIRDFTISLWTFLDNYKIKSGQTLDRQFIFNGHAISKTATSNFYVNGFNISQDLRYSGNTKTLQTSISLDRNNYKSEIHQIDIAKNWNHIVFIRKGNNATTYVNGELVSSISTLDDILDMQHAWFIGTFAGNNSHATGGMNYSFDGKIDDIRVYNRALNESEIQLLYDE